MNSVGVKTQVLIQHYQKLRGPERSSAGLPTLQRLKQIYPIYRILKKIKKSAGRDYNEKPKLESLGTVVRQMNQDKDRQKGTVLLLNPLLRTQRLAQE